MYQDNFMLVSPLSNQHIPAIHVHGVVDALAIAFLVVVKAALNFTVQIRARVLCPIECGRDQQRKRIQHPYSLPAMAVVLGIQGLTQYLA